MGRSAAKPFAAPIIRRVRDRRDHDAVKGCDLNVGGAPRKMNGSSAVAMQRRCQVASLEPRGTQLLADFGTLAAVGSRLAEQVHHFVVAFTFGVCEGRV